MVTTKKKISIIIISVVIVAILSFAFLPVFQPQREAISNYLEIRKQIAEQKKILDEAQSFFDEEKYEEALEKYQEVIDIYYLSSPGIERAILGAGRCHQKLGNLDQAISTFQGLIEDFPDSKYIPDTLHYSAVSYLQKGEPEKAEEYINKILNEYPETREWIINAANALLKLEVPAGKLYNEAQSLFAERNYQEALKRYQELLNKYPQHRLTYVLLQTGRCHQELGNLDQALLTFQELMKDYPNSIYTPDAFRYSAGIYLQKGEPEKAEEYINKALSR